MKAVTAYLIVYEIVTDPSRFSRPSRQAASEFWHSEEYSEIKKLREGAAVFQP
jgi:hypothetical protein